MGCRADSRTAWGDVGKRAASPADRKAVVQEAAEHPYRHGLFRLNDAATDGDLIWKQVRPGPLVLRGVVKRQSGFLNCGGTAWQRRIGAAI